MAYETTIYPAKAALHALLGAFSWTGDSPTVLWGPPSEDEDVTLDAVYQGTTVVEQIPFPGLSTRNDEEYTLPVVVDVRQYGDDEQATEQHAWEHVNDILTLLRANLSLSGTVSRIGGFDLEMGSLPEPDKWRTQIVVRVQVVGIVPA
jgi:hypothetical protein